MVDYEELNRHRKNLKLELLELLKTNDRVACVQPTGIGKSYLIAELCNELPGNKIILEPGNEIINYMNEFKIETKNTTYITYYSLLNKNLEELIEEFKQYDYIFLDEMHRVLAEKWGNALNKIFDSLKGMNKKILGFSATPIRGDRRNVIDEIFNGIQTKPYYLADAILNNLLPNPNYHCGIYEITNEDKQKIILKDEQLAKEILSYDIDSSISKMIEENLDLNKNHKIICFVDKIKNIKEAKNNVMKWFNKELNIFEVHHNQSKNAVNKIIDDFQKVNGLNILFCVNILNEGVHIPNVDCVIFLRKTASNVIYNQQLGRAVSQNIEEPIIFDLVNNATNPEWGYYNSFKDKAKEQNKKVEELETKNGEKLKIKLEQVDLIEKLKKINNKNKNIPFSKEEIKFIKENAINMTINDLAKSLNKSKNSIRSYCYNNNIKYLLVKTPKPYTEEELEILRKNAPFMTINKLSKLLNRTEPSIKGTCKRLKIDYIRKIQQNKGVLTNEDIDFIKKNLSTMSIKEISKILNKKDSTIRSYINTNNLSFNRQRKIRLTKEEIKFIKENAINMTAKEIASKLNRSYNSISCYLKRHSINYKKEINFKFYTEKEIKFIKENAINMTAEEIANKLNRTKQGVIDFCNRNKIQYIKN